MCGHWIGFWNKYVSLSLMLCKSETPLSCQNCTQSACYSCMIVDFFTCTMCKMCDTIHIPWATANRHSGIHCSIVALQWRGFESCSLAACIETSVPSLLGQWSEKKPGKSGASSRVRVSLGCGPPCSSWFQNPVLSMTGTCCTPAIQPFWPSLWVMWSIPGYLEVAGSNSGWAAEVPFLCWKWGDRQKNTKYSYFYFEK